MATIEELLGFDEVCYLLDAYTDSLETNETYGESVENILCAFPDDIKNSLPGFAKKRLFGIFYDLNRPESFDKYVVGGRLYVYHEPERNGLIKRISFDTYICKKPQEKKQDKRAIEPPNSLMFHATVKGDNLSEEHGIVQYPLGCSAELWQLNIPKEKVFEPVTFKDGISRLENIELTSD